VLLRYAHAVFILKYAAKEYMMIHTAYPIPTNKRGEGVMFEEILNYLDLPTVFNTENVLSL
jgi:hypothetical protein